MQRIGIIANSLMVLLFYSGLGSCAKVDGYKSLTGSYCSVNVWSKSYSFFADTMIIFPSDGEPMQRYLYKIQGNTILKGKYIDEGYYKIVNLSKQQNLIREGKEPIEISELPPPIPYGSIEVDSNNLEKYYPEFEIIPSKIGDTILSSLFYRNSRYFEREYMLKWIDGDWKEKVMEGIISRQSLKVLDSFLNELSFEMVRECNGEGSDGDEFWISIDTGKKEYAYYFSSPPFPPQLSGPISLFSSISEDNTTKWSNREMKPIDFGKRLEKMCR